MSFVALGELVEIKGGGTPDKSVSAYWGGTVPWASVKDFKGTEISQTVDTITQDGVANSATNIIPENSILVPTRMAVGKAAINTVAMAINQDIKALTPKAHVDLRYLLHALIAKGPDLERQATGATVKGITLDVLRSLPIPLPHLDEQKRLAAILDQADELRRKRQSVIDRLSQLGQAIFHEMFGKISGADTAWKVKPLADLCDLVRGSSPRPQGDPRYFGGPVPRLMIADITRDGMNVTPRIDSLTEEGASKSRPMPAGSVVMAVSGAVGLPAILSVDACIHDGFVGFRNLHQSVLPEFFYWFLRVNREQNKSQGTGAIWVNLTTDQVKRFNVPVPPINLQERFVTKMKEIAAQGDLQISNLNKIDRLFASLQHRAFQGEL